MPINQWCGNGYAERSCCGEGNGCIRDGHIFRCKPGGHHGGHNGGHNGGHGGWCKHVGQVCNEPYSHSECCGGASCQRSYGDGTMRCTDRPQCVQQNQVCGGPNPPCCAGRCTRSSWDNNMRCQPEEQQPRCLEINQECGHSRHCCTGVCTRSSWYNTMTCQPQGQQPHCAQIHQECGGPGRRSLPCCDRRTTCQRSWNGGGNVMRCVDTQQPEPKPQCVPLGQSCGGYGRRLRCCEGSCQAPWWGQNGEMRCRY